MAAVVADFGDTGASSELSPALANGMPTTRADAKSALHGMFKAPAGALTQSDITQAAVAAALKATQAQQQQRTATVGAPMSAMPTPSAPSLTAMAPRAQPVTAAPQQVLTPAVQAAMAQTVLSRINDSTRVIPFAIHIGTSLNKLSTKAVKPSSKYNLASRDGDSVVVVREIRVNKTTCTSAAAIGVVLGGLPAKHTLSLPDCQTGPSYHVSMPRGGTERHPETVYTISETVDTDYASEYGAITDIKEIAAELERCPGMGIDFVPVDSTAGRRIAKNRPDLISRIQPSVNSAVPPRYVISHEHVEQYLDQVNTDIIQNENFRRALTPLDQFDVTLVPLNKNSSWTHIPELMHADQTVIDNELQKEFSGTIEGEIVVMVIKKPQGAK